MWLNKIGAIMLLEFLTSIINEQEYPKRIFTDEEKKEAEKMLKEVNRCLEKDLGGKKVI